MSERLERIQKKLDRADEHLKALHDEFKFILNNEGNCLFAPVEFDADMGWYISKIGDFSDSSTRISILAGEACHQLLSALEHSIWQMIEANKKTPNRNNRFPLITEEPLSFASATQSCLQGVPIAAREIIENVQPYKTGDLTLHFVKTLADRDKHRFLLTWIVSISDPRQVESLYVLDPPGPIEKVSVSIKRGQRLEAGTELARVRLTADNRESKVYVKGRLALRIDVRETPEAPIASDLDAMSSRVAFLIDSLGPFL